ncbi:MAG: LacI family DNA-binding transcriptional regulator [Terrimicrobiaceae bacterium]
MKRQPRNAIRTTSALAEVLGLSRWAVSRSLNGGAGVSAETAERVKEAARQLGFRPNTLARGLRAGQTEVVGVCLPDPEEYYLGGKLGALLSAIFERGLEPLLQVTDGSPASEERALGRFAAMRCPKVVTFACRLGARNPAIRALETGGTKLIHLDPIGNVTGTQVIADRAEAMLLAVRHLHERGHRRFCVAGLEEGSAYAGQRRLGLRHGADEVGVEYAQAFVFLASPQVPSDFEAGKRLAGAWLELGRGRPGSIIALNDRVAFAMMSELKTHGLRAPQDFGVIGYDATELGEFCDPPLTTIDPRHELLIAKAAENLWGENTGRTNRIRIAPTLIARASTGEPTKPFPRGKQALPGNRRGG